MWKEALAYEIIWLFFREKFLTDDKKKLLQVQGAYSPLIQVPENKLGGV